MDKAASHIQQALVCGHPDASFELAHLLKLRGQGKTVTDILFDLYNTRHALCAGDFERDEEDTLLPLLGQRPAAGVPSSGRSSRKFPSPL